MTWTGAAPRESAAAQLFPRACATRSSQVLATPGVDSHSTYVALSRHRETVDLYCGRDDFANQSKLVRVASRERGKDMASDYRPKEAAAKPKRGMFDDLKLTVSRNKELGEDAPAKPRPVKLPEVRVGARSLDPAASRSPLDTAIERFARVTKEVVDVRRVGGKELPHELDTYRKARQELDAVRPGGANDLREAFGKSYKLTSEAAAGRTAGAITAMDRQVGTAKAARAAERARTARRAQGTDLCGAGRGARQPQRHGEEPAPRPAARVAAPGAPRRAGPEIFWDRIVVSRSPAPSRPLARHGDVDVG
ncbi:hypothetical protein [Sphingopyxis sp.]|uniref:hypothetical protein n=1 Tax=Sphingopyxis sp. TaxID=1908224 RepID=UPI001D6F9C42|nr:hypothetical protein [Sphingopyxis sp.]MBW8295315.1 hypothetical protein [Sphingopyxis sp.]